MGRAFLLWFVAALLAGVGLLLLGSWFQVGGLPPAWARALHGRAPTLESPAGQAALRSAQPAAAAGVTVYAIGDRVPADYTLPDLNGQAQSLAQYRGRRVLLNFWATWCHPCLEEMPALQAAGKRHAGTVQIIGIAMDQADKVQAWLKHTPVGYPIWLGMQGDASPTTTFGDTQGLLPYSVLIDAQGRIVATHMGKLSPAQLEQWLAPKS